MKPAARMGDHQTCPKTFPIPHTGGPIRPFGRVRVWINGRRAARRGSNCQCVCPQQAKIKEGVQSVKIQNKPAAVVTQSTTTHQGIVKKGSPNVYFGNNKHNSQEQAMSCVIASSRNMIQSMTGNNISESQLRNDMRKIIGYNHDWNRFGMNPQFAVNLLQQYGVNASGYYNLSINALIQLVANNPALVVFPGHHVMLESVFTNQYGQRTFVVRDPAPRYGGNARNMSEQEFRRNFQSQYIVIAPKCCDGH